MKKEHSCNCPATGLPVNTILLGLLLIGAVVFGTCGYLKLGTVTKQVGDLHSLMIENRFGSTETFNEFQALMNNEKVIKQTTEQAKQQISDMKDELGIDTTAENADSKGIVDTLVGFFKSEEKTTETVEQVPTPTVDTSKANADTKFAANSAEAESLFGLSGTPGNAVINRKTGTWQAIGGAYPNSTFQEVVKAVREGSDLSAFNTIGKSGSLTKDELEKILEGVYFYGDENADIVIVEYSDLLCPFCQRHFNDRTIESIVDADKSVALVFKNNPIVQLHPTAAIGAKGVECAGELGGSDAFYKYIAQAFTYKKFNATNVVKIAQDIGLDAEAFAACFNK